MFRIGKPVEIESLLVILVVSGGGGWVVGQELWMTANMEISFQDSDNVLKLNCDDGDTSLWIYYNPLDYAI